MSGHKTYTPLVIVAGEQVPVPVHIDAGNDEEVEALQVAAAVYEALLNAEIRVGAETFTKEDIEDFWS